MHHVDQYCRQKLLFFLPDTEWVGADFQLSYYIYMYLYSIRIMISTVVGAVKLEFVLVLSVRHLILSDPFKVPQYVNAQFHDA